MSWVNESSLRDMTLLSVCAFNFFNNVGEEHHSWNDATTSLACY